MLLQKWSKLKFKYCTWKYLYFTHIEIEFGQNIKEVNKSSFISQQPASQSTS